MLSLLMSAIFVLWNCVKITVSKLRIILKCSEQNIFILVVKTFQHISVLLSILIDRVFKYLLNINMTETCTEKIK